MKMKIIGVLSALVLVCSTMSHVEAAEKIISEKPTCVMMNFTDETRFHQLDSDKRFAELVLDKLLDTGKVNLQSTKPIPENMEEMLYNDRYQEMLAAKTAIENNDLSAVFEGPTFQDKYSITLSTAEKGQVLAPAVTSRIGKDNNAEYLIQGTILQMGQGSWIDRDFSMGTAVLTSVLNYFGAGIFGAITGNMSKVDSGFGVVADMRIIRAETGEVIWSERTQAKAGKSNTNYGLGESGSINLSESDYVKALDKAADNLVAKLVKDMKDNKVF
jgi:hypothetical protein